ncbi:MAG: HAD family phosphatase [Candidatus Hydrogenedentes bacterium]|nr:HAD family phosphatase [Candidatus Hydrogenedentota bacterium]MBI3119063.1 HAD family phosphatase [Candidatus Hydrogenedentota bacterium]
MYGLIFDVDGVLADTEGPICKATMKMFRDLYNLETRPEDFVPFIGTGAVRYVEGPAALYGITVDLPRALEARSKNFFDIVHSGESIAFPGVNALIDDAAADPHWKLAIATSSPGEKSRGTLVAAGIDANKFDAYLHGDLVTHKKPHPEIYLKAIDALGLPAAQCVVVEDALTGVEAAKAAGAHVVGVTTSFSRAQLAQADIVVDSLEELSLPRLRRLVEDKAVA